LNFENYRVCLFRDRGVKVCEFLCEFMAFYLLRIYNYSISL
jgi:hypothetical protein